MQQRKTDGRVAVTQVIPKTVRIGTQVPSWQKGPDPQARPYPLEFRSFERLPS